MNQHIPLAIINITPDSFSDGGLYNTSSTLAEHILDLTHQGCLHFDLGAESTSPISQKISPAKEWRRWEEIFLPLFKNKKDQIFPEGATLSLDSVHLESVKKLYDAIGNERSDIQLIWNDQYGVCQQEVLELLHACPRLHYVFMHSFQKGTREEMHSRGQFFSGSIEDLMADIRDKFFAVWDLFKAEGMSHRLIFDPGFSFGKSPALTRELIMQTAALIGQFVQRGIITPWMLGISRKTCLRDEVAQQVYKGSMEMSEAFHFHWLVKWQRDLSEVEIYFRLHDPKIFFWSQTFLRWFKK